MLFVDRDGCANKTPVCHVTSEMNDIGVSDHAIRDVDGEVVGRIAVSLLRYKDKAPASIISRSCLRRTASSDQQRCGNNGCCAVPHGA